MNKNVVKEYKRLNKLGTLDKVEIHFLLKKLDDKLTIDDFLNIISSKK